ncbi:hypothetical protein PI95_005825 [Hassallia byssoidea VB512170]|uniref:Lipoprotein n=1 Tax=Hassallia byssoidea VB512170 TaxID=1304833 RepID=A0A846H4R5_9CYAN|nr:hypothetical protein [Hassalia byssoidea]NEU72103.1 hypothetical protein [Hassalia byssoidea VB512170]
MGLISRRIIFVINIITVMILSFGCESSKEQAINSEPLIEVDTTEYRSVWQDSYGNEFYFVKEPFSLPTISTFMPDPAYFSIVDKNKDKNFPPEYNPYIRSFHAFKLFKKNGLVIYYGRASRGTMTFIGDGTYSIDPNNSRRKTWMYFPKCVFNLTDQTLEYNEQSYDYYQKADDYFASVNLNTLEVENQTLTHYEYDTSMNKPLPSIVPAKTGFCKFQLIENSFNKEGVGNYNVTDGNANIILSVNRTLKLLSKEIPENAEIQYSKQDILRMLDDIDVYK